MKDQFLFSNKIRWAGWVLLIPGLVLGFVVLYWRYEIPGFALHLREEPTLFQSEYENFSNELALLLVTVGLLIIAFSKEKQEDELLTRIRSNALYWAILVNFIICFVLSIILSSYQLVSRDLAILAKYSDASGTVFYNLFIYNLFTPLIIFIARYQYLIHSNKETYLIDRLYYLPRKPYRLIGIIFSIPLLCVYIYCSYNIWVPDALDFTAQFTPLALMIWAYTKEPHEDEFIASLRLRSMQLAVYIYYILLLVANVFVYSILFLYFMMWSPVIIALIFIISFTLLVKKSKQKELEGGLLS